MQEHKLFKRTDKRFGCEFCRWDWANKATTLCPGVIRYAWGCQPSHLNDLVSLHKQNLKPKKGAKASGCYYSMKRNEWTWFYDEKDCELDNPELPHIVQWDDVGELKTIGQLEKLNLAPNNETKPRAVAWAWDSDIKWGVWVPLYHEEDCRWEARDNWITKTQLKEKYLLSEGWIKKIGKPNKVLDHPRYRNVRVKLYSRKRVEEFLAYNAIKYAEWLDKRDKYIAIFEANKEKILANRQAAKEQTQKCLKCTSGCSTPNGFLCAIYPMGLLDIPCRDFQERFD